VVLAIRTIYIQLPVEESHVRGGEGVVLVHVQLAEQTDLDEGHVGVVATESSVELSLGHAVVICEKEITETNVSALLTLLSL
jgi:hypothetical protein